MTNDKGTQMTVKPESKKVEGSKSRGVKKSKDDADTPAPEEKDDAPEEQDTPKDPPALEEKAEDTIDGKDGMDKGDAKDVVEAPKRTFVKVPKPVSAPNSVEMITIKGIGYLPIGSLIRVAPEEAEEYEKAGKAKRRDKCVH